MGIKYKVNEEFFDTWSRDMAYILGYIFADGSLDYSPKIRGRYIKVASIDRESVDGIKSKLGSAHRITTIAPDWPGGHDRYILRIGSHKLFDSLTKLGLYPNKSLTVKFPDLPTQFLGDFVRGYFDGDGCVHLEMGKGVRQQPIIKRVTIVFTSGSKIFLERLAVLLQSELLLKKLRVYNSQRSFQLHYGAHDSIKLFKFIFRDRPSMYMTRKADIFQKYFSLRPIHIDKEVQTILRYLSHGHVVKKLTRRSAKPLYAGANPAMA